MFQSKRKPYKKKYPGLRKSWFPNIFRYHQCLMCKEMFKNEIHWSASIGLHGNEVEYGYLCMQCAPTEDKAHEIFIEKVWRPMRPNPPKGSGVPSCTRDHTPNKKTRQTLEHMQNTNKNEGHMKIEIEEKQKTMDKLWELGYRPSRMLEHFDERYRVRRKKQK